MILSIKMFENIVVTILCDKRHGASLIPSQYRVRRDRSDILGRELGPSGVSPNQRSRWKHASSPLKHV